MKLWQRVSQSFSWMNMPRPKKQLQEEDRALVKLALKLQDSVEQAESQFHAAASNPDAGEKLIAMQNVVTAAQQSRTLVADARRDLVDGIESKRNYLLSFPLFWGGAMWFGSQSSPWFFFLLTGILGAVGLDALAGKRWQSAAAARVAETGSAPLAKIAPLAAQAEAEIRMIRNGDIQAILKSSQRDWLLENDPQIAAAFDRAAKITLLAQEQKGTPRLLRSPAPQKPEE